MSLLGKTAKTKVLELINAENAPAIPFTEDNLYFGKPRLLEDGITSVLPTTAMLGTEYAGYANLQYRRIDLRKAFDDRPILKTVGHATLHRMIPLINQWLGMDFTEDDIYDTNLSAIAGGSQINILVRATPKSIGYTGDFIIRFLRQRIFLAEVVTQRLVDELNHPIDPAMGKLSIQMALWNVDFTNDRTAIAVRNGGWQNLTQLKAVMEAQGFPNWPTPAVNEVTDHSTKDIPNSNQNYNRVAIQRNVVVGNFIGDAYLHYNS